MPHDCAPRQCIGGGATPFAWCGAGVRRSRFVARTFRGAHFSARWSVCRGSQTRGTGAVYTGRNSHVNRCISGLVCRHNPSRTFSALARMMSVLRSIQCLPVRTRCAGPVCPGQAEPLWSRMCASPTCASAWREPPGCANNHAFSSRACGAPICGSPPGSGGAVVLFFSVRPSGFASRQVGCRCT